MKQSISFKIWAGLITLYVAWGSTYLAIRFVVEKVPPLIASGVRVLLAGSILYGFSKFFGKNYTPPTRKAWLIGAITGFLMLSIGNGALSIAAAWVPSGYSALFSALVPVCLVLMQWWLDKTKPNLQIILGVVTGIAGVGLLLKLNHLALSGQEAYFGWGVFLLIIASISWAVGVMITNRENLPYPPALISGMQLISGGVITLIISALLGEWKLFELANLTAKPVFSFLYLVSIGSLLGFSVFGWLSQQADPTLVSTYTYVNPLVAILLGWIFAGESLNLQLLMAASFIVGAVVLITFGKRKK